VEIYGFVIMPNHIHLLWKTLDKNRKENPAGSFTKYTAHAFKKYLELNNPELLEEYKTTKNDRKYQFWKRDPLAILISNSEIFYQKLEYIHLNPTKEKWGLANDAEDYHWSSANFYQNEIDEFGFLKRVEF
jgi:REP element-mobilizing transposase RayT